MADNILAHQKIIRSDEQLRWCPCNNMGQFRIMERGGAGTITSPVSRHPGHPG